ncbi:hypothetical protein V1498_03290 [Peribacillus sp. SCS-26]|uniref:hypothetical protein n=1 Tax=Paraperibacillus marinus TaxID=3115295 RepID=UPI003905A912
MSAFVQWFIEPYTTATSEMRLLGDRRRQAGADEEKQRIGQLITFNLAFIILFSVFLAAAIIYPLISLFMGNWYGFGIWVIAIPMMLLAKAVYRNRYLKRRDAFIKGDPDLINR